MRGGQVGRKSATKTCADCAFHKCSTVCFRSKACDGYCVNRHSKRTCYSCAKYCKFSEYETIEYDENLFHELAYSTLNTMKLCKKL